MSNLEHMRKDDGCMKWSLELANLILEELMDKVKNKMTAVWKDSLEIAYLFSKNSQ